MICPSSDYEDKQHRYCIRQVSSKGDVAALATLKHIIFELTAEIKYADNRVATLKSKAELMQNLAAVSKNRAASIRRSAECQTKAQLWQAYAIELRRAKNRYKTDVYKTASMILRKKEAQFFVDNLYPEDVPLLQEKMSKRRISVFWDWYNRIM